MADWVREYTCGSCREYEYEGENVKGYCAWYRTYYYPDDSCSHWEKSEHLSSGSSGCFITTACCVYKGLSDDCELMTTIRQFRDTWLVNQEDGKKLIREYYRTAPFIVEAVNNSSSKNEEYERIYQELTIIKDLIDDGKFHEAKNKYTKMVFLLQLKYLPNFNTKDNNYSASAII